MRRKATVRRKAKDGLSSNEAKDGLSSNEAKDGLSSNEAKDGLSSNEAKDEDLSQGIRKDEIENLDLAITSKRDQKKGLTINSKQDELNSFESSSKTEEKKIKKNYRESTNKKEIKTSEEVNENVSSFDEFGDDSALITKEVQIILKRHERLENEELESCDTAKLTAESIVGKAKSVPNETGKGTKRKRGKQGDNKSEDNVKPTKSAKKEKESDNSKSIKKQIPDVTSIDFNNESKSSDGNPWNFKISSWNINGIRAWLEKNGLSYLHHEKPDILCVQETKCSDDKLPEEMKKVANYHAYWLSGDKDGYSGVGLLSKEKPLSVEYGIGISEHDNEGRVITAEYGHFYLVAVYVPNAGRGLVRLKYRMEWDKDFHAYLKKLDAQKPVILCGDLNVAHEEIDLANPKTNKRNAGFTKEERNGFSTLLGEGFIDSFRHLYPDVKGAYTFWTYMMNARAKDVGWRLDYFVISERLREKLCDSVIRKAVFGSDHCPITLFLSF